MIEITWLKATELLGVGLLAGFYGSLVGLGGGFVVVPMLFLFFQLTPQQTVGTSVTAIFFTALSGTIAYTRQKRIDYRTGIRFALATLPGAGLGAYAAKYFSATAFSLVFGLLLLGVAIYVVIRPRQSNDDPLGLACAPLLPRSFVSRKVVDSKGHIYRYAFKQRLGILISFFVGFIYNILGIGGGIIHVPAMVYLFSFPPHIATATSTFILSISALAGSAFHSGWGNVLYLPALLIGAGGVMGAQGGAALSQRLQGKWLMRSLVLALIFVGGRLLLALRG